MLLPYSALIWAALTLAVARVCVVEDLTTPAGVTLSVELMVTAAVTWRPTALSQEVRRKLPPLLHQTQHQLSACQVPALADVVGGMTRTAGVMRCVSTVGTAAVTWRPCAWPRLYPWPLVM